MMHSRRYGTGLASLHFCRSPVTWHGWILRRKRLANLVPFTTRRCGHCGTSLIAQEGSLSGAKFQQPVGIHWRFVDQTAESTALEMDIREDMRGPAGSLEDGVVASLAEVAGVSAIGFKVGLVATEHLGVSFLVRMGRTDKGHGNCSTRWQTGRHSRGPGSRHWQ